MSFIDEKKQQFYDVLTERMARAEEQAEKERADERRNSQIRQLGNVLTGLSNLYWTTQGAPSQNLKPAASPTTPAGTDATRLNDRLLRAHESITKLRMADARTQSDIDYKESLKADSQRRTDADIAYKQNRQENESRKTDADIEKRRAEAENLNAKGRLATSQSELKDVETGIRRQEAANLPVKQQQEAEVRKARARQAWAAALRQRNQKPKKKTLKRRR
jgi:hypothetical protein